MNEPQYKDAKFWNRHAKGYAKSKIGDEASYQHKLEVTRGYLTPQSDVMEFACGTGSTALQHAPLVRSYLACDFSDKMIAIADEKLAASPVDGLEFKVSSIQDLDIPAASLDVVMGHSILHLLEHPEDTIAKNFAFLKPGGHLISSTVCMGEKFKIFKYLGPIGKAIGLLPVINIFTPDELIDMHVQAGFEIELKWQLGYGKPLFLIAKKP